MKCGSKKRASGPVASSTCCLVERTCKLRPYTAILPSARMLLVLGTQASFSMVSTLNRVESSVNAQRSRMDELRNGTGITKFGVAANTCRHRHRALRHSLHVTHTILHATRHSTISICYTRQHTTAQNTCTHHHTTRTQPQHMYTPPYHTDTTTTHVYTTKPHTETHNTYRHTCSMRKPWKQRWESGRDMCCVSSYVLESFVPSSPTHSSNTQRQKYLANHL